MTDAANSPNTAEPTDAERMRRALIAAASITVYEDADKTRPRTYEAIERRVLQILSAAPAPSSPDTAEGELAERISRADRCWVPGLGHVNNVVISDAEREQVVASLRRASPPTGQDVREALERAAKWHEDQADTLIKHFDPLSSTAQLAKWHWECAEHIRALSTTPASPVLTEEEGQLVERAEYYLAKDHIVGGDLAAGLLAIITRLTQAGAGEAP